MSFRVASRPWLRSPGESPGKFAAVMIPASGMRVDTVVDLRGGVPGGAVVDGVLCPAVLDSSVCPVAYRYRNAGGRTVSRARLTVN
jgi:hypothetical protein